MSLLMVLEIVYVVMAALLGLLAINVLFIAVTEFIKYMIKKIIKQKGLIMNVVLVVVDMLDISTSNSTGSVYWVYMFSCQMFPR